MPDYKIVDKGDMLSQAGSDKAAQTDHLNAAIALYSYLHDMVDAPEKNWKVAIIDSLTREIKIVIDPLP